MCLIAFALGTDPACPLLIAGNRDEILDRPTAPLHRWTAPGGDGVVAGRDLRDGGTWLGVTTSGRVAMLTNVRETHPGPGRRSRGELPTHWLTGDMDWRDMANTIDPAAYGGFNLVVGDFQTQAWAWIGNRDPAQPHAAAPPRLHTRSLGPGVYGLSNATLDTPWPKTTQLKHAVAEATRLAARQPEAPHWIEPLNRTLSDEGRVEAHELPATGAPLEWERALSSPFVRMPGQRYGTRSSLVLRAMPAATEDQSNSAARWAVHLHEWTHTHEDAGGAVAQASEWKLAAARHETLQW
jgi:uncharacterized protein with NRDE domain